MKMEVSVYNVSGQEVGKVQLDPSIFGLQAKSHVIHQVVVSMQANARQVIAHTKGRSEVRGGGKKPWRQKGTGRARHGSIRSPLWVGGGITFGPTKERNFKQKINKKMRRLALNMVLSNKVSEKHFLVIDSLEFTNPKTKQATEILKNLKLRTTQKKGEKKSKSEKVLVIEASKNEGAEKSFRNIQKVDVLHAENINILDILKNDYILISQNALDMVCGFLGAKKVKSKKSVSEKVSV